MSKPRKQKRRLIWGTESLNIRNISSEKSILRLRQRALELIWNDAPQAKDLSGLIQRYQSASDCERDAINETFVWFTGYRLITLVDKSFKPPSSPGLQ